MVDPIPDGYPAVIPYLAVRGAGAQLDFVKTVFGATEKEVLRTPEGAVRHAEAVIGDSMVMIGEVGDERPPDTAMLYMYVRDVDAVFARALAAGASVVDEVSDTFYGDRSGGFADPHGNKWYVATHIEDVSPEEMQRRMEEAAANEPG